MTKRSRWVEQEIADAAWRRADELAEEAKGLRQQLSPAIERAEKAERERDEARARWEYALEEAKQVAGHEIGLWSMGAIAAVGQLREQLCSALVLIRSHGIGENSATLDAALAGRDTGTAYAALRLAEDFVYEAIVDKHFYGYSTAEAEVVLATIRDARKELEKEAASDNK